MTQVQANEVTKSLVKQEQEAKAALEKEIDALSPEDRAALYYREALPAFERKLSGMSKKGMQRILLAIVRRAVDSKAVERVRDPNEREALDLFDVILGAFYAMFNHSAMEKVTQAEASENNVLKEDKKDE